jgi:uncharacterized protein (TIGR02300 family)
MSKVELGNKHLCLSCNTKFYDLQKEVPVCPKCNEEVIIKVKPRLGRPPLNKKPIIEPPKVKDEDDELDSELEDLVSIEDLDKNLIADNDGINSDENDDSDNLTGIADLDDHSKNEENNL